MKTKNKGKIFTYNLFSKKALVITIFIIIAGIYIATRPVNHSEAEDSIYYLIALKEGPSTAQFHPNHLLFNFVNYNLYKIWTSAGYNGSVELPCEMLNILSALIIFCILFIITSCLNFSLFEKLFCITATAFSFGFWFYSVGCDTYILPIVFIALCIHRVLLIKNDFRNSRNHILLGLFNAMAILFHQQHLVLCIVILTWYVFLFLKSRNVITWKEVGGKVLLYGTTCLFVTSIPYLIVAVLIKKLKNTSAIIQWALGHAAGGAWDKWTIISPLKGIIAFFRIFIGGHFIFSFSKAINFIEKIFPSKIIREEIFLVKSVSIAHKIFFIVGTIIIFFILSFLLWYRFKSRVSRQETKNKDKNSSIMYFKIFAAIYFFQYTIFNLWWEPLNIEFWISFVPITVISFMILIKPILTTNIKYCVSALVFFIFMVNLFGSVLPQTKRDKDYWYNYNSWFINNCTKSDLVVMGSGYISKGYIKFYSGADVFCVTSHRSKTIEQQFYEKLSNIKPNRVFFSSTAFSPLREIMIAKSKKDPEYVSNIKKFFKKIEKQLVLVYSDSQQDIFLYNQNGINKR